MGASAGGLSAFNRIINHLPEQLNAAGFDRLTCRPYSTWILPETLNRAGKPKASVLTTMAEESLLTVF